MTIGLFDTETKELLKDIIEQGGFSLQPTYAAVFDINNELNDEILFTIRYTSGGIGLGSPFGNWFAPLQSGAAVINGGGSGPTILYLPIHLRIVAEILPLLWIIPMNKEKWWIAVMSRNSSLR